MISQVQVLSLVRRIRAFGFWGRVWFLAFLISCGAGDVVGRAFGAEAGIEPAPAERGDLPPVFQARTPSSVEEIKLMEERVRELVERLSGAVVAVQASGATGSGVVVSKDGLVMCAAHVCVEPGRSVSLIFPDGTRARGTTLGTDHGLDAGLIRITEGGERPFARVGELHQAELGDWVLALGHPGGFDPDRPVVARLGRIIRMTSRGVQTDCSIVGGDSGGPLFDMHGRVVGIHSRISESNAGNFHVPVATFHETWARLLAGENWGAEREQRPRRPYVGARGVDDPGGCRLELVDERGPAYRAGVRAGDLLVRFDGEAVKDTAAFRELLSKKQPGEEVAFEIRRGAEELLFRMNVETRRRGGRPSR